MATLPNTQSVPEPPGECLLPAKAQGVSKLEFSKDPSDPFPEETETFLLKAKGRKRKIIVYMRNGDSYSGIITRFTHPSFIHSFILTLGYRRAIELHCGEVRYIRIVGGAESAGA